ncbi:membrane protein [Bacillus sp. OxB-1]|uniref:NfeD family protein n=1 Tax=Bacillus sp. (strain OxB-1) TaxID=98228 RepID=UPI00058234B9|nr:NfeD family protein [Bacillus sp. OxB-1]BAQ09032.1 membrane protein [Bacillus sp. OxB-1]
MEIFGMSLVQFYLVVLIISGLATVLYVLFSDLAEGIGEGTPLLDPAVLLPFITFVSASGYVLELTTSWHSGLVIGIALIIAVVLDFLLYFFVLLPLRSAEVSLAYTDESLVGQVGKVIVPVPKDGYGEIVIESVNGIISKRAAGYENEPIEYDKEVLIMEVRDGTFIVKEYEPFRFK